MSDHTFTRAVADLLASRPGQWIDGRELARVGGVYAWRSRVSEARRRYGLRIENRQRRLSDGSRRFVVSEYRLVQPGQQRELEF